MKKNNLATFEDFAKLNELIEEDNVKGIYDFFVEVIQTRYGAGHQEQHLRDLKGIMIKYEDGMWSKAKRISWAKVRMVEFYGHVAGQTLV
jgi:hypothetical protein